MLLGMVNHWRKPLGSHLTHDFKRFCGIGPSAFRAQSLESRQDHRF